MQGSQSTAQFFTATVAEGDAAALIAEIHAQLVVDIRLDFFHLIGGAQVALAQHEGKVSVVGFQFVELAQHRLGDVAILDAGQDNEVHATR